MAGRQKSRRVRRLLPLPRCAGPKLHAFEDQKSSIEWLERLDGDRRSQSGAEGCVFKVRIDSRLYALKVVSRTHSMNCIKNSIIAQ